MSPIDCVDRGALRSVSATALFPGLAFDIADREIKIARRFFPKWPEDASLPSKQGPGNALLLAAQFDHVIEIVTGFGKLGVSAESLAKTAAHRMAGFLATDAFVEPYLADQLLLPFALAGGASFTTVKLSQHSLAAADIIERFTGHRTTFEVRQGESNLVTVL